VEQFKQTATICSPQYPAFDYEKFAAGWQNRHLNMLFPEPGVLFQHTPGFGYCKTLTEWDSEFPEICQGHWEEYLSNVSYYCGSWEQRHNLPPGKTFPYEAQLVAGVLQLDRKYLRAAIRRLYGVWVKPSTPISYGQLKMSACALWNPDVHSVSGSFNWASYLKEQHDQLQRKKEAEQRRETQIAELFEVFDEVQG